MQIKPEKMIQWPPSPSVEDEATALSHEHSIDAELQNLKSDDQPAIDRGSVDQYPVIIDSPDLNKHGWTDISKSRADEHNDGYSGSSDDSAGPPTPPPLLRKEEKASSAAKGARHAPEPHVVPEAPPISVQRQLPDRGRPQIARIQTDVGGDVRAMASGSRRPPSPYSYTRTPTFHGLNITDLPKSDKFLSPTHAVSSQSGFFHSDSSTVPREPARSQGLRQDSNVGQAPYDRPAQNQSHSGTNVYVSPPTMRSDSQIPFDAARAPISARPSAHRSFYDSADRPPLAAMQPSPSHSRKPSRESTFGSSGEDVSSSRRRPTQSRKSTDNFRDSPHTSSTEDSSREYGRRSGRSSGEEQKKLRRRSSHRSERPIFSDSFREPRTDSVPASALDGPGPRQYRYDPRARTQPHPMTPASVDFNKATMEDYFERAFKENEMRRSQRLSTPRHSGSALASPLASPPRTPKSEAQNKDYFNFTPTAQRPVIRSRPPSPDEGQIKDPKMRGSLLSVATAGAAVAAKVAGTKSSTSDLSSEGINNSASRVLGAHQSGRPSPLPQEIHASPKIAQYGFTESPFSDRGSFAPVHDARPVSRGTLNGAGSTQSFANYHPSPHRALSYSGPEHVQPWNGLYPETTANPTHTALSPTISTHNTIVPQSRSARTSVNTIELLPTPMNFTGLPKCPRPQPVVGYNDWYTIKEMSTIDICPACAGAMGSTKYRDLLVPSLPRPYNEPSVCAMSKAWVRVAFLQSLRQNRPDLDYIRTVTTLPKDTRACAGDKKDIRSWFFVVDPQTRDPIPEFSVCSACVRTIDTVFPDVCKVFDRPKNQLNQERSCNMHTGGKYFQSIIDQLEQVSIRCKGRRWRSSDMEELIRHLRRVARRRPCPRDELQTSRAWHIMPDLPEFTICEECYDEAVWPVHDRAVAREISKNAKSISHRRRTDVNPGISCQLYSDRMRKIFRNAVESRSITALREAVAARVSTQHRLDAMNRLYEQDLKWGIPRHQELEHNQVIWRGVE